MSMKQCNKCKGLLPLEAFSVHPKGKDGRHPACKLCRSAESRERYVRDKDKILAFQKLRRKPEKDKDWAYQRKYGISLKRFSEMEREQKFRCLICGKQKKLVVDHCHKTGYVRGLLCHNCNIALGLFRDDPNVVRKAITYLEGCRSGLTEQS